jgi:hypothetical protein
MQLTGTEAEMFCFDSIANLIVGKPCEFLVKTMDVLRNIPSALSVIVGLKFTFVVTININSCYVKQIIFNVSSVLRAWKIRNNIKLRIVFWMMILLKLKILRSSCKHKNHQTTAMGKLSAGGRTTLVGTFTYPINYNCNYLNRVQYLTKNSL